MGNTASASASCNATSLQCAFGEPQEVCVYGSPCDWAPPPARVGCWSKVASCACPTSLYSGAGTSNLQYLLRTEADWTTVMAGPAMLWGITVIIVMYLVFRKVETFMGVQRKGCWEAAPRFPFAITRQLVATWAVFCALATAAMVAFATYAPADVWGTCSQQNICVYHSMFCEATRHGSPIRHPANAWTNLPYIYTAIGIFVVSMHEAGFLSSLTSRVYDPFVPAAYSDVVVRPYQLLDLMFAVVLITMAAFSVIWHSSNCTEIHFVDVGLMNCVIAFFPYRFICSIIAELCGATDRSASKKAAVGYALLCALLFGDMYRQTEFYINGFPTGKARAAVGLGAIETALYIGLPGLYPVPTFCLMSLRRKWGYVPAMLCCLIALPTAFMGHASERLVLDFRCDSTSLLTQPTATFHIFSGIAIAAAYVQARALMLS